jgi:predicted nucleic acid-binding protein
VSKVVVLDAGPLGYAANPKHSPLSRACSLWIEDLIAGGCKVVIPEISDYEVRRELLRAGILASVSELDRLPRVLDYLALTTSMMRKAAELWAVVRQQGRPTASDKAIDGDVILAAQALSLQSSNTVVATTNVGHLSLRPRRSLAKHQAVNLSPHNIPHPTPSRRRGCCRRS